MKDFARFNPTQFQRPHTSDLKDVKLQNKPFLHRLFLILLRAISFIFFGFFVLLIAYRFVPVPGTPLMVIRSIQSTIEGHSPWYSKTWVPQSQISFFLKKAVIASEDAKFYSHSGFDYEAIEKAIRYNKTHQRKKGASTITQQTVKNLFLWPSRDWIRKGLEAAGTFFIEIFWPKDRILEVYLNIIEFGRGVYGVEAASQKYFKKSAKNLSAAEAALLTAVLPNPRKFKVESPSNYVIQRQHRILARMLRVPKEDLGIPQIQPAEKPPTIDQSPADSFDTSDENDSIEDNPVDSDEDPNTN